MLELSFEYILVNVSVVYQVFLKKELLCSVGIKKAINQGITRATLRFECLKMGLLLHVINMGLKITSLNDK